MKILAVLILWLVAATSLMAADTASTPMKLYVFSKTANLQEKNSNDSKVIMSLTKGQPLDQLETKDLWIKVKVNNKEGWVNKYLVSATVPTQEKTDMEGIQINLKKESRKRASAYSTAASARGLADDTATKNIRSDIAAVKKMEDAKVKDTEVKQFIKEGKLINK